MTSLLDNIHLALPEMVLLATACLALLCDLFFRPYIKHIALVVALVGLSFAGFISFMLIGQYKTVLFSGLFVSDDMAQLMNVFIVLSVLFSFIYSHGFIETKKMPASDYYVLGLFSTLGMMVLVSAHSLLTMYLGLELLSLPLYAMTAIRRTDSDASEAALKYFVMGAIASGMLLYGMSLLYGATGHLNLLDIANAITNTTQQEDMLLSFALVFIIAGVGFKLASVPFHMWAPDVYQGAPTSVTLFISAAPKIAALAMAFRMFSFTLVELTPQWQQILLVMALLSTGLGNLLAIAQTHLKRMLAYSAISHVGYALFGILSATSAGYGASLYYILVYSLMTVAAFGLIVILSKSGRDIEYISDLAGLNKTNPGLAFFMLIVMFSMAGVPPTVGFFTKLLVLKALVDAHMVWVAVLGLLFAVIGAYYYIRVIKVMYFDEAKSTQPVVVNRTLQLFFGVNCLSLLYLGIFPTALIHVCLTAFS